MGLSQRLGRLLPLGPAVCVARSPEAPGGMDGAGIEVGVAQNETIGGANRGFWSVFLSTYQGNPFWNFRVF